MTKLPLSYNLSLKHHHSHHNHFNIGKCQWWQSIIHLYLFVITYYIFFLYCHRHKHLELPSRYRNSIQPDFDESKLAIMSVHHSEMNSNTNNTNVTRGSDSPSSRHRERINLYEQIIIRSGNQSSNCHVDFFVVVAYSREKKILTNSQRNSSKNHNHWWKSATEFNVNIIWLPFGN